MKIRNRRKSKVFKWKCLFGCHEFTTIEEEEGKDAVTEIVRGIYKDSSEIGAFIKASVFLSTCMFCKHCRVVKHSNSNFSRKLLE